MGKYIALGDFNKKYFIIFIIFLITKAIKYIIIFINSKYRNKLITNKLLTPTLPYIGQFLCFIPLIISKKCYYKKFINKYKKSSIEIKYLFNNQNNRITFKNIIFIIVNVKILSYPI